MFHSKARAAALAACLFLGPAWLTAQTSPNEADILALLPGKDAKVSLMEVGASPRLSELTAKLQGAAQANAQWFQEFVKKAPEGQPLPYDARLGVSEAEYKEYLALAQKPKLQEKGQGKLTVTKRKDGKLFLEGDDSLSSLTGITIDPAANQVDTPYGSCATPGRIEASPDQAATGPWNGYQWKLEGGTPQSGEAVIARFALGKMVEGERCMLYYTGKKLSGGQLSMRSDFILMYPPRGK